MSKSITHQQFLENTLNSKKIELQALKNAQVTAIAVYETTKNILTNQIDAIEHQLESNKIAIISSPVRKAVIPETKEEVRP